LRTNHSDSGGGGIGTGLFNFDDGTLIHYEGGEGDNLAGTAGRDTVRQTGLAEITIYSPIVKFGKYKLKHLVKINYCK
jgi:hypothetical protein